jgi:hypothetical protein
MRPELPDGIDALLTIIWLFWLDLSSPPRLFLTGVCASSSSQEQRKTYWHVVQRICNVHARLKHAAAPRL